MSEHNQREIYVPALEENGQVIIPEFRLGIPFYAINWERLRPEQAEDYHALSPPTLAELRHAFFGGSEDYRRDILSRPTYCTESRGEYTDSFLSPRALPERLDSARRTNLIEIPDRAYWDRNLTNIVLEGGRVTPVELPPPGWILEFDASTGLPSRTSQNREDAVRIFGDDASISTLERNDYDVQPICRYYGEWDWCWSYTDRRDYVTSEMFNELNDEHRSIHHQGNMGPFSLWNGRDIHAPGHTWNQGERPIYRVGARRCHR